MALQFVTKSHLENFTEKLLTNDKKIRDELKEEISNLPSGGTDVDVATVDVAGIVKPDGTSVTVDVDGTIHATTDTNQIKQDIEDYMTEHPVSADVGDKTVTEEKLSDDVLAAIKGKKVLFADTVADINNLTLSETENQIVRTLGFYNKLDGGGALYNVYKSTGSKNLIALLNNESKTSNYTCTTNSDGYIVLDGNFPDPSVIEIEAFGEKPLLKTGNSYTMSYEYVSGSFSASSTARFDFNIYTDSVNKTNFYIRNWTYDYTNNKTGSVTIQDDCKLTKLRFLIAGSGGITCDNLVIRFQIEEGTESTEWKKWEYAPDGHTCIALDNDFRAEMIVENNSINMEQIGYFPNNREVDCHDSITNYLRLCERDAKKYELHFTSGTWHFSETDISNGRKGVILTGVSSQASSSNRSGESAIKPFNNNQKYIWNIGVSYTSETIIGGNEIKNFVFTTDSDENMFCDCGLLLTMCCYSSFDGLYWHYFNGTGLRIRTGWENDWGILNFRCVGYIDKDKTYNAMEILRYPENKGYPSAVSANIFDYINFEGISGSCIYCEESSNFTHSEIRNVQLEWTHYEAKRNGVTVEYNVDSKEWDDKSDNIEHVYLLKGNCGFANTPIIIETITISSANKNCYTITYTDNEGIKHKRYKVRSAIFGENEGYVSSNTRGIRVCVGKIEEAGGSLPLYHSAYGLKNDTSIKVLHASSTVTVPECEDYYNSTFEVYNWKNKIKIMGNGDKVIFPNDIMKESVVSSFGHIKDSKSSMGYSAKHGTFIFNLDGSKKIKYRLYMKKPDVNSVETNIIPNGYITGDDGVRRQLKTITLKRSDFASGKYPLNEWFDYEVPAWSLPLSNCIVEIILHKNNGVYIDYVTESGGKKSVAAEILTQNNATSYSSTGSTIWCNDRRETEDSSNGVMMVFDGTKWRSLTGKPITDLLLAKYTITSNLTNCTGTNSNTSALLNTSYTTTISAASGYSLTDADIICTMGGNPITVTNGKISISKVTGDIVITANAI